MTSTKLLPQKRHRDTASSNSSTTQLCPRSGSHDLVPGLLLQDGGRMALRLHPVHLRTIPVDKMNEVIEQRPKDILAQLRDEGRPHYPRSGPWCRLRELHFLGGYRSYKPDTSPPCKFYGIYFGNQREGGWRK